MRKSIFYAAVVAIPALLAGGAAAQGPGLKTFTVDCAAGDSINQVLARNAGALIVNVVGLCVEDVVIQRDRVTLRGADPAADGIQAATLTDRFGAALLIRRARYVRVENLTLSGARRAGLRIEDSRREIEIVNCRIENNQEFGIVMAAASAVGTDLVVTGNGFVGVGISEAALLQCDNCTIADNPGPGQGTGLMSVLASQLRLNGGLVSARLPVWVRSSAFGILTDTTVVGRIALRADQSGDITFNRGTVDGSLSLSGDSQITLLSAQQISNPTGFNTATGGSLLTVGTLGGWAPATVVGTTYFEEFSHGVFRRGTSVGALTCVSGADAQCEGSVARAASSCSSCP